VSLSGDCWVNSRPWLRCGDHQSASWGAAFGKLGDEGRIEVDRRETRVQSKVNDDHRVQRRSPAGLTQLDAPSAGPEQDPTSAGSF
jgi:hypothetical protein